MEKFYLKSAVLCGKTAEKLREECQSLLSLFRSPGGEAAYRDLTAWSPPKSRNDHRAGFVWESLKEAVTSLEKLSSTLTDHPGRELWADGDGGLYRSRGMDPEREKLVALFPGQGALYVHIGAQLCKAFPVFEQGFFHMDEILSRNGMRKISELLLSRSGYSKKEDVQKLLYHTQYSQPTIGVFCAGLYRIMESLGFAPAMAGGMSFGEIPALWAGGILSDRTFFRILHLRGTAMAREPLELAGQGAMMAVSGDEIDRVGKWVEPVPDVVVEAWNSDTQLVLSGRRSRLEDLQFSLQEQGIEAYMLPVSGAFHSPFMENARQIFASGLGSFHFGHPKIPVYSNLNCSVYPDSPWMIRQMLADHIRQPVYFRHMIQRMHSDGGFAFVEFSPKQILSRYLRDILGDKPHIAVPLNSGNRQSVRYQLQRPAMLQVIFDRHPPIECSSRSVSENGVRLFGLPRTLAVQSGRANLVFEGQGNDRVIPAELIWRQAYHGGMKICDRIWREEIFPSLICTHPLDAVTGPDKDWKRQLSEAAVSLMVHGYIDRPLDWLTAGRATPPAFNFSREDTPALSRV